jgi:type VII secretion-associated protein (TIGR03931 family)
VVLPASWSVRRVTDGPGSRRLQAAAPAGESVALHVTQSVLPHQQSFEQIAATLSTALATESAEVFTGFRPDDRRAGRQVATYHERRPDTDIAWFVTVDGVVRIAIGCQTPLGREDLIAEACDAAVRSAHAVF